jgi:tRNA pseudouridine32 synthase/23S rRNA pseudouridine746 synthase
VVYEDKYLVVVDKPSGVLCVPTEQGIPSLAQTVFESVTHKLSSYDRMVVHRLGMDTSGLVIFAKTMDALRGMNTLFRTRQVTRQYEVLVCGHVLLGMDGKGMGTIDMPLMRDYVFPPYMRVSTDAHQQALVDLDPLIVGKKLLEAPKPSQTKYEVVHREVLLETDLPVTRMTLTSITGRTHQLNVHCAAFGHPIVGDRVYGLDGEAAPHGGLLLDTLEEGGASIELQREIAKIAKDMDMCVHAKRVNFRHPVTGNSMNFESPALF